MSEYFDLVRAALESRTSRSRLRELLTEPERNTVLRSGISVFRTACKNLNPEMEKLLTLIQQVWRSQNADEILGACLLVISQAGAMLRNMSSWQTLVGVMQVFSSIARGQRTDSQKLLDVLRLEYGHLRRDARADLEKKIGMVVCLIEIIKICLIDKSANPGIVDSLLASTQGLLYDEDNIPKSVSTTFRFYVGKHKLFLDDFEGALSEMEIAYSNCRDGGNGERILFYLIPLKMAQGVFPSKNLLCKFPRLEVVFKPIIKAIRLKNLTLLDQSIGSLETHFFSILRSFRSLLIRGILREIQKMALKKRLIDFSIIQSLGISEIDVANLIRCGMLSGYISYEEQAVVLTGSSPFPLGPMEDDNEINGEQNREVLVGQLDTMCSLEEARLRTETRQIDKFEMEADQMRIDVAKAVKKYQRSSADKKYLPQEVRTVSACWRSLEYLIHTVLDFDLNPKPGFSHPCYSASYFDIYSFMRDRLRAVRVDLHVQNLLQNPAFIKVHEYCLRFELLSLFLLWGRDFGGSEDRKFDLHLSLTALSQTIDPLTAAYAKKKDEQEDNVDVEAEITKYVLLLSLTSRGGSKTFKGHYLRQSERIRSNPHVRFAYQTVMDYYSGNYEIFLRKFITADFLTACAMLPVVNTARTRILWTMVRTNRPFFPRKDTPMPPPRPEKISFIYLCQILAFQDSNQCKSFLEFHGLDVVTDHVCCCFPPRQLTKNPISWWTSSDQWRLKTNDHRPFPEFSWSVSLEDAFHKRLGEDVSDLAPSFADYPKHIETSLVSKYDEVTKKTSRSQIVAGPAGAPRDSPKRFSTFAPPVDITIPSPPPSRPLVPIQPLTFAPPPVEIVPPELLKRSRESPDKTPPSTPSPPDSQISMSLANSEVKPPPKRRIPVPAPNIPSAFDMLSDQLSEIIISAPQLITARPHMPLDSARELEIGRNRSKFVALRCVRSWWSFAVQQSQWKRLLGGKSPLKLN